MKKHYVIHTKPKQEEKVLFNLICKDRVLKPGSLFLRKLFSQNKEIEKKDIFLIYFYPRHYQR